LPPPPSPSPPPSKPPPPPLPRPPPPPPLPATLLPDLPWNVGAGSTTCPSVASSADIPGVVTDPPTTPPPPPEPTPPLLNWPHIGSEGVDLQIHAMLVAAKEAFEQSTLLDTNESGGGVA
ncbi:MAG: hypothetical protein EOP14_06925, partial [Pseudomonas sp.]